MINHVVAFKLNDYSYTEKVLVIAEMKKLLEDLKEKIDLVKFIEVGVNYELDSKSFDLVLISHFETLADLETYRVHPEHQKVVKRFAETTSNRAAVDYIF